LSRSISVHRLEGEGGPAEVGGPPRSEHNPKRPLSYWNFRSRGFEPALKEAKLDGRGITVHQLRHAAVSMFAWSGLTSVEVAAIVGHADSSVTAKVYSHLFDRTDVEARVRAAQASLTDG